MKCGGKTRTKHGKIYLMGMSYFGLGREHIGSFPGLGRAMLFQKLCGKAAMQLVATQPATPCMEKCKNMLA